MKVGGKSMTTIWTTDDGDVAIIDQRALPHRLDIEVIRTAQEMATAIADMHLRGAIVIGVAGAFGVYLAARDAAKSGGDFFGEFYRLAEAIRNARPTAVNLAWGVDIQMAAVKDCRDQDEIIKRLYENAKKIMDVELNRCRRIGEIGAVIIRDIYEKKRDVVNILTHCNAGWLACVDWGTALAPIFVAREQGIPVFVWVDETRPRNQGAKLTAWELLNEGIPFKVVVDNAGGLLMMNGMVDMAIVGADRVARNGDVANKIGTYLKALAANAHNVPFYVAFPTSTYDINTKTGKDIPIEERSADEVLFVDGLYEGRIANVLVCPEGADASNYGFDITPSRLITGFITEQGVCRPVEEDILAQCEGAKEGV